MTRVQRVPISPPSMTKSDPVTFPVAGQQQHQVGDLFGSGEPARDRSRGGLFGDGRGISTAVVNPDEVTDVTGYRRSHPA
ncbi:MAG: hypothetical protein ACXWZL_07790, partial [Mycobacterium sp.]